MLWIEKRMGHSTLLILMKSPEVRVLVREIAKTGIKMSLGHAS